MLKYPAILFFLFLLGTGAYPLHSQPQFSQDNAASVLQHLSVTIGARPMGSPAEQEAMEFAVNKFKEYGCDTAYIMPITKTSSVSTNTGVAIGIKRGATKRTIVIGGHIDSAEPEIPGANDDGSGSAVVIEASRVLCSQALQSTIVFCCFGGEEQGLIGSRYFVDHFSEIDNVALMLQVDMANGLGTIDLLLETYGAAAPSWLVKASIEEFYKLGYSNLRYSTFFFTLNNAFGSGVGSDHEPFLVKGIPAIDFTTNPADPIHTPMDNFENFDQRGLQRSGDLVLALIGRFDMGVPSKTTERYLLFLTGQYPIFVPVSALWLFIAISSLVAILALFRVRKQRIPSLIGRKWPFIKITFFTILIVSFGWFSSNLVGLIKGVRHPWFAHLEPFYLLTLIGILTGVAISIRLSRKFQITTCPYKLFRFSFMLFFIALVLASLASVKMALAPAFALCCIGVAFIVKNGALRVFLVALSPFWMLRFIFSEWKEFIFRTFGMGLPTELTSSVVINLFFIIFFSLYILPFSFIVAAVARSTPSFANALRFLKSPFAVPYALVTFVSAAILLTNVPSYTNLLRRDIHANFLVNMEKKETSLTLKSPEYLDGVRVNVDGTKLQFQGRTTNETLTLPLRYDSSLVTIDRSIRKEPQGDITEVNLELQLRTKKRPYRIVVTYSSPAGKKNTFIHAPYPITTKENLQRIEWYSFPDTALTIPLNFQIAGNDTLDEEIKVIFSESPAGVAIEGELCYVIPRMEYISEWKYHR